MAILKISSSKKPLETASMVTDSEGKTRWMSNNSNTRLMLSPPPPPIENTIDDDIGTSRPLLSYSSTGSIKRARRYAGADTKVCSCGEIMSQQMGLYAQSRRADPAAFVEIKTSLGRVVHKTRKFFSKKN